MSVTSLPRVRAKEFTDLESQRIVSLQEAARLKGVSVDTLTRNFRSKLVKRGTCRLGMRLGDALNSDLESDSV
jgi:hypothetical protein